TLQVHRHRRLVPIEALARTLAPMPHLRVRHTYHPVLFRPRFDLATARRLLLHILRDQTPQQRGRRGSRFCLLGMGRLRLLGPAQQPPGILHDHRQQLLALFFVVPVNRRLPFQAAAKVAAQALPLRPPLPAPPTGTPVVRFLPPADCRCPSPPPCPRSAWCPTPPGSCDSAGSPPAAPPRS